MEWIKTLYDLSPIEKKGDIYFKREDLYSLGTGINGSKMRQCLWLVDKWFNNEKIKGVISGGVSGSPQHPFISEICKNYGIGCKIFTAGSPNKYPYLQRAIDNGAEVIQSKVGYAKTLEKKAFDLGKKLNDWRVLETNITLAEEKNKPLDIKDFHSIGAYQVRNIPEHIENMIIPAGSCNSITSVLYGLYLYPPKNLKTITIMGIGNNGSYNLKYIPDRLKIISKFHKEDISEHFGFYNTTARWKLKHYNLNGEGYCNYNDLMDYKLEDIDFHPRYEGKVMNYIKENKEKFKDIWNENLLFWIIGGKL